MSKSLIAAVLWDMDGVLIDSEPGYNITVAEMVNSLGYPYGECEIAKVTGSSYKNIAETLGFDMPRETIQRLYVEALMQSIRVNVSSLCEGAPEFLDILKTRGVKLAIGSSSPKELVDFAVDKFGLHKWFDVIVTGKDAENGKPSPEIYLKCAKLLGVAPSECLVIEDSANGILAGKNAGMYVCAFTGTRHHDFDLSKVDFEIDSFSPNDLVKIEQILKMTEMKTDGARSALSDDAGTPKNETGDEPECLAR
jgi:HAD superfamily hydrolase (TIGR01509 family)